MFSLKYSEILKQNRQLRKQQSGDPYQITVLSNITTSQINEILEYCLRNEKVNAYVQSGAYDNIVQDSNIYKNEDLVVIFWELANLVDGLSYIANIIRNDKIDELIAKVKAEIDFVMKNLKDTPLVFVNRFTSLIFETETFSLNNLNRICNELNEYLDKKASSNIMLIDIDKIIAKASVKACVDWKYYYSAKALYTIEFYKYYVDYVKPIILATNGRIKKVLVLDCDDTIWKGIIGEDGIQGIEMSSQTEFGSLFSEIQNIALGLRRQGVLLGLCSKNNPEDVDEVFLNHPDMILRDKHITIKRVNWKDKVSNLKSIAKELNVGLDSIVFMDDSDFEINYVREALPQVTTLKVPENLYEYPKMVRDNSRLFYQISTSEEDLKKHEAYQHQVLRDREEIKFNNQVDYLASLGLELKVFVDNKRYLSRFSQLTMKTNQFNSTTKRYMETDIKGFISDDNFKLYAFDASDKFGDYGVTGLCVIKLDHQNKCGEVDTFLMSCRVMGRKLEYAFFDYIITDLINRGIKIIKAEYIKTLRNKPIADFYQKLNFKLISTIEGRKLYSLDLGDYQENAINYITLIESKSILDQDNSSKQTDFLDTKSGNRGKKIIIKAN